MITSPLKWVSPFILTIQKPLLIRMRCTIISFFLPSGSKEEVENVKSLERIDRQTDDE